MSNVYSWQINALDSYPEKDGKQNVVFNIYWNRSATDGTNAVNASGIQGVALDPAAPFTSYSDLTEEKVVEWLTVAMGEDQVSAINADLDNQINNKINPPVVTLPLPWRATPAPLAEKPASKRSKA